MIGDEKWECVIPLFNLIEIINDGWLVISFVHVPTKNPKPFKSLLEGGGGKGRGGTHMYDRQRYSEKWESVIPHFNLTEIIRDGLFVIWFIHVSAKNTKQLKPFLEGFFCGEW